VALTSDAISISIYLPSSHTDIIQKLSKIERHEVFVVTLSYIDRSYCEVTELLVKRFAAIPCEMLMSVFE